MQFHRIVLYACAVVVVGAGARVMTALGPARDRTGSSADSMAAVLGAWRRGPVATSVVLVLTIAAAVAQLVSPAALYALERDPHGMADGQWWRLLTALFVQSSGAVQIAVNLPALAAVGAVAEGVLGPWRWLPVYLGSGLAANAVSAAGWSRHGAGSSVAICGLVGALASLYALRGADRWPGLRAAALLVPAAGAVLCLMANNHGAGLLTGGALGALLTVIRPHALRVPAEPVPASGAVR